MIQKHLIVGVLSVLANKDTLEWPPLKCNQQVKSRFSAINFDCWRITLL